MTNKNDINYVNPFLRGASGAIDIFIVGFLRIFFAQILGVFWINGQMAEFYIEFQEKFKAQAEAGKDVLFDQKNQEHVQFLMNHEIVKILLIFVILIFLIGALYHAYLNASTWSATVGKRICGLILVKNEGKGLTFWQAASHYFLSIVPWLFMFYILSYQVRYKLTLYAALTTNTANFVLGILTVLWIQIHIITKKKNTVSDVIVGCSMVKGKIGKGWPKLRSASASAALQRD